MLFTNYESMSGMQRQLPFLKRISRFHLLLVVFFENTELKKMSHTEAKNVEEIYVNTIAGKMAYEKKLITMELAKYGIQSILTPPADLTINTINRYLKLKRNKKSERYTIRFTSSLGASKTTHSNTFTGI